MIACVSGFPNLYTRHGQRLVERHDGSSAVKVHQVLQRAVARGLTGEGVVSILQCVNHKMSAAICSSLFSWGRQSVRKPKEEAFFSYL